MIYVVEFVAAIDDAGTTATFLYGTAGFVTSAADTPAHAPVRERLAQPLNYSRALDPEVPIGLVTTGYGECVLHNQDGALDAMVRYGVANRSFTVRASEDGSGAYPAAWTTLLVASMERIEASVGSLRIILRDGARSYLDKPICTSFAGTGGLEGHAALAGTPRPRVYGAPFNVPLVRINDGSGSDIYMVSDKALVLPQTNFDGRVNITNAAGSPADFAALVATPVTAGQALRCEPQSLVKLGSVPVYPLTCDPIQRDGGATRREASGQVISDLLTDSGAPSVAGGIASSSWGGLGYFVRDAATTYATALDEMLTTYRGYGWFDRVGTFQAAQWSAASVSVWTFSPSNARALTLRVAAPRDPIVIEGPRNFSPSSLSDTATGVSREYRNVLANEYLYSERSSPNSQRYAQRQALIIKWLGFSNNSAGNMVPTNAPSGVVSGFASLFGVPREVIEVTAPATLSLLTTVDIGSEVTVRWPRYSLSAGVLARVSGVRYELASSTVTFTLWR